MPGSPHNRTLMSPLTLCLSPDEKGKIIIAVKRKWINSLTRIFCFSTKESKGQSPFNELVAVNGWSDRLANPVQDFLVLAKLADLSNVFICQSLDDLI